jgi:hypothetical protein
VVNVFLIEAAYFCFVWLHFGYTQAVRGAKLMEDYYNRLRRHTVARSVLSIMGAVFLVTSFAFWGVLHYSIFVSPAGFAIPQIIVAVVMTVVYSLALPLLLSMLIPTTPAGQFLQKTQWRTIGFPVVVASALFLAWHARNLMLLWFSAQPLIEAADQQTSYTLAALIGFVIIPALAWVQVTPDRWLSEIQTAHQVKKLELMQRGEIAILKARLAWVEAKAISGYARLIPAEQQEVRDTLKGLLMGMADSQRAIVRTMGIQADVERAVLGDQEIAQSLDYVAQQLERPAKVIDRALTSIDDCNRENDDSDQDMPAPTHMNSRLQSSIPYEAEKPHNHARPRTTTHDDAYVTSARSMFGKRPWTMKELAEHLAISATSAKELRAAWYKDGIIRETTQLGRWYFTERT